MYIKDRKKFFRFLCVVIGVLVLGVLGASYWQSSQPYTEYKPATGITYNDDGTYTYQFDDVI